MKPNTMQTTAGETICAPALKGAWRVALVTCACLIAACLPLRATQLLQYSFDDYTNATFTLDGSPNPTNGFFTGTATRTAYGSTPNGVGYALNVVGSNGGSQNWLTVSNCAKLSPAAGYLTNLTITFWMNLQGNPNGSDRVISKEVVGPPNCGFGIQIYGPGTNTPTATNFNLSFGVNNVGGSAKTTSSLNASNQWVFCAVTYDGTQPSGTTNIYWYKGTPNSAVAQFGSPYAVAAGYITNTTVPLRIGSTPASGSDRTPPAWFKDVEIYDTVLTTAQIETIRQANALPGAAISLSTPSLVFAGTNVTFTVTTYGLGNQTPTYQWWFGTNLISGATNATYTVNGVQPSDSGLYGVLVYTNGQSAPLANLSASLTVADASYNPSALSFKWKLGYSFPNYLNGYGQDRSMVYNAASTNLILCHRASTPYVAVLDPLTGALKGSLDESGLISQGYNNAFPLNEIGVGDDGVIYSGNMTLTASSVPYVLYSWQNESAAQVVSYNGDPGAPNYPNLRWGDAMAVRGSGANTQILLSSGDANTNSTNTVFSLLTTTDGVTFTSQAFMITNMPGASANVGLAWGGGSNTFYAKSPGYSAVAVITNQFGLTYTNYPFTNQMYYVQFDTNSGFGTVLGSYPTSLVSGHMGPIGTSLSSNWMAGLEVGLPYYGYDYLSLYSIADATSAPAMLSKTVVAFNTQNGPFGGVGGVSFGNINGTNYIFVLDTMNGVYTYAINASSLVPPPLAPLITSISPAFGRTNGNTLVAITGSNFLPGATVQFGAAQATGVALTGSTNLTVYTPAGLPGTVDVVVINTNNLSTTNSNGFTYVLPPPPAVIVPGSTLKSGATLSMVWLGGTNSACELQSATNLTPPVVWLPVQTNQVGVNGFSTNSVAIDPSQAAQFFRLAIPYN